MFAKLARKLREYLLLGTLTIAPLALTMWVFAWILRLIDNSIPEAYKPFPGIGIIACLGILLLAGLLTKTVAGTLFTGISEGVLNRLPIVRSIYSILKQISSAIFSDDATSAFKKVVCVRFFSSDCRVLAFVTGELAETQELVLFVPTSPNPTSGYTVFFHRDKVEECSMTVEEALRVIVSCGSTLAPKKTEK